MSNGMKIGFAGKMIAALAALLVVLSPGATAQGALDLSGAAEVTGRADARAATSLVNDVVAEAQSTVEGALAAVESVDVDVQADIRADLDASGAAEGASQAGVGFIATAKGYFRSLLDGIAGMFGRAKAEGEAKADLATATLADARADAESQASAKVDATATAASQIQVPQPPPPPKPRLDLTASLQAALTGLFAIGA